MSWNWEIDKKYLIIILEPRNKLIDEFEQMEYEFFGYE